jgi:hypothetical protein
MRSVRKRFCNRARNWLVNPDGSVALRRRWWHCRPDWARLVPRSSNRYRRSKATLPRQPAAEESDTGSQAKARGLITGTRSTH